MVWGDRSKRQRQRHVTNGHLSRSNDNNVHHSTTISYPRLVLFLAVVFYLVFTNPAHSALWSSFTSKPSSQSNNDPKKQANDMNWWETAQNMYTAYQMATNPEYDVRQTSAAADQVWKAPTDETLLNFGLFSVQETRSGRFRVHAASRTWTCQLSHNTYCQGLRHFFLPSPQQRTMTSRLIQQPYFGVYRLLLLWVVLGAGAGMVLIDKSPRPLAWTRGWRVNPYNPLASTLISLLDLRLLVVPALEAMQQVMETQTKDSWFRLLDAAGHVGNYAWAVLVFLMGASAVNMATTSPLYGYSSDVWAAAALGYLRGTEAPGITLAWFESTATTTLPIPMVLWTRVALQAFWVHRFHVTPLVLWFLADVVGYSLARYQVTHQFMFRLAENFMDGVQRFFGGF